MEESGQLEERVVHLPAVVAAEATATATAVSTNTQDDVTTQPMITVSGMSTIPPTAEIAELGQSMEATPMGFLLWTLPLEMKTLPLVMTPKVRF